MIPAKLCRAIILLAAVCAAHLEGANQIWITPPSTSVTQIPTYTENPLALVATLPVPAVAYSQLFQTPGGSRIYLVGSDGNAVYIYKSDFSTVLNTFTLGLGCTGAAMTPDGSRFLILSGALRVFDTSTELETTTGSGLNVGSTPSAVAASLDSTKAYVLDQNNKKLMVVDLGTNTVSSTTLSFGSSPTAVSVGPNGLIYVSAASVVYEVDPTTLKLRGQISVDGTPGELRFTPDGTKAVALNKSVTGSWALLLDLVNRTILGTLATYLNDAPDAITIAGNDVMYATSTSSNRLYKIVLSAATITTATFDNVGNLSGVVSAISSDQSPLGTYLFAATSDTLYRVIQSTNQIDSSVALSTTPGVLMYMGAANTGTVASALQYNNSQSITPGGVGAPLVVRALDANGKPLYNVPVAWTASTGATLSTATATTNRDGLAETFVTAPSTTGTFQVVALLGSAGTVQSTFTLTSSETTSTGNATLSIYSGNGQIAWSYSKTDYPLVAQVLDSSGNAVSGVTVTWAVSSGGGSTSVTTGVTDSTGLASAYFTGGTVDSTYYSYTKSYVTATTTDYGSVTFTLTTIPIVLTTGGVASYPSLVLETPASTSRTITGKLGETISAGLKGVVYAAAGVQMGSAMSDVGLFVLNDSTMDATTGPVAACTGTGSTALSDSTGTASCDLKITGVVGTRTIYVKFGGSLGWAVQLTATVGDPGKMTIVSGDGQSGRPGATLGTTLVAEVSDGYGNTLPGATVTWSVVSTTSATLSNVVSTADANGRVSATVTLGSTTGTVQVRVKSDTGSAQAVFSETVALALATPTKVSGDKQTAVVSTAFTNPLVIQVNDTDGNVASGVAVTWAVTSGSATLSSATSTTNSSGQASVNVTAGATAGAIVVTATVGTNTLTFTLTARLAGPVVTATDFYNGASFVAGVTPGGIVTIRGTGLATDLNGVVLGNNLVGPLPTTLEGVTVTFGSTAAPIFYVSNVSGVEQVTVQAPFELTGSSTTNVTITVNGSSTLVENVVVSAHQPGMFLTTDTNGYTYAVLTRTDGSYVTRENPAKPKEILKMYATGLGQTTPATATGSVGVDGQSVVSSLIVGVNNAGVRIVSSQYMEGEVGMYVITFEVPSDAPTGATLPLALGVIESDGTTVTFGAGSTIAVSTN